MMPLALLLAMVLLTMALPATAQTDMHWDAGKRCFKSPGAESCGHSWNVETRQFEGSVSAAGGDEEDEDAENGNPLSDDLAAQTQRIQDLATNYSLETLRALRDAGSTEERAAILRERARSEGDAITEAR